MYEIRNAPSLERRMAEAYRREWSEELRRMTLCPPLARSARVLDVGCGDGFFTRLLSERMGPEGALTGVDADVEAVEEARKRGVRAGVSVEWRLGWMEHLPFRDGSFDFVWCARDLAEVFEPLDAVREMVRVLRPGGVLALAGNDAFHRFILPWPPSSELIFRAAEFRALQAGGRRAGKHYLGRSLRWFLGEAGLSACAERAFSGSRQAPLSEDARVFMDGYLQTLRRRIQAHLPEAVFSEKCEVLKPCSPSYLLKEPSFSVTSIDHLIWGRRPL
jgi:ubiquinone/menaquinone biosynthesis C-methylase UbiE